ncbi:MAG: SOS response-associated peptidase family protein [Anaerostipes sp.]|nr:SOS response-associated peptidase family protein [Anaerostipes sp.]
MCGRYFINEETIKKAEELVKIIDLSLAGRKEIYPSGQAPVILRYGQEMAGELCYWGFERFDGKGLVINARSETVLEKRMFKKYAESSRCAVPAAGFYEWGSDKIKYAFYQKQPDMYMAGILRESKRGQQFVILTAEANESVKEIHSRMPLVLRKDQVKQWVLSDHEFEFLLHQKPEQLEHSRADSEC